MLLIYVLTDIVPFPHTMCETSCSRFPARSIYISLVLPKKKTFLKRTDVRQTASIKGNQAILFAI